MIDVDEFRRLIEDYINNPAFVPEDYRKYLNEVYDAGSNDMDSEAVQAKYRMGYEDGEEDGYAVGYEDGYNKAEEERDQRD